MILDHEDEYGSQWEAICSVADKLGPNAEMVGLRFRRGEARQGKGRQTGAAGRVRQLSTSRS